jgi:serine/threonine protein kinase
MNIESINPFRWQPSLNSAPKGYGNTIVLLALAALAGLAYYLIQRHLALSIEGQKIRDGFENPPESLSWWDLRCLANKIESLQIQEMMPNERCKIEVFPAFTRKKFMVSKGHDNTLRVQYVAATLGQGGYGKVVQLVDLQDGKETALKVAKVPKEYDHHPGYLRSAEADLQKEYDNLMLVHTSKHEPRNVQDKPVTPILTVTKLYDSKSKVSLAYEGSVYDGSLNKLDVKALILKTRLWIALQVLQGMETLLVNKLISHDLKPANVLYRGSSDALIVHVSDLGGVTHQEQLGEELNKGLVHTPAYADPVRIGVASAIPIGFVQKGLVRDSEKCSIGLTIIWVLTGHLPTAKKPLNVIWEKAGLPSYGKYKKLRSSLENSFNTSFFGPLFKDNLEGLKKKVEKLYNQISPELSITNQ